MGERSLSQFTAKPRQLFAATALCPPSIGIARLLLAPIFVGPATMLGRTPFRDVRPNSQLSGQRDNLRRVVALVGNDRFDGVLAVALIEVHCCVDHRVDDCCRVSCSAGMNGPCEDYVGIEIDGMLGLIG